MNYTDEQLKRVAGWLGQKVEDWQPPDDRGSWATYVAISNFEELKLWDYEDWLLSPEGEKAIRDKFIEEGLEKEFCLCCYAAPDDGSPEYIVEYTDDPCHNEAWCPLGHAETISEAWLDAAINFMEKE